MAYQIFAPLHMLLLVAVTSAIGISAPRSAAAQCLAYEPKVVRLSGVIVRETHPGRPNYESIANGDEPETIWVLKLKKEICVIASDDINVEADNEKEIQLVLEAEQYRRYRRLLGQRVTVSGRLFHSHTGHHHKALLLKTNEIRKQPAP
ncbi:MAG TPA: DUF4431 domain-containing protein [Blastocatellia bacterium]|nr:DUF4431 domain-containing protein [Blastocatellia bacterium]